MSMCMTLSQTANHSEFKVQLLLQEVKFYVYNI